MRLAAKLAGAAKQDSSPSAVRAKATIRHNVLTAIGAERAHVFDGFAGSGHMFGLVWRHAASCTGCDKRFFRDGRVAFVADNVRVLRAIDLGRFNVFDFDAYGSPWEQITIVLARRRLQTGESIGLVLNGRAGHEHAPGQPLGGPSVDVRNAERHGGTDWRPRRHHRPGDCATGPPHGGDHPASLGGERQEGILDALHRPGAGCTVVNPGSELETLRRENADLKRQVVELRQAVDALLQPAPSELLSANLTISRSRKTSGP